MTSKSAVENPYDEKAAAVRYDSARRLPPETKTLWLDAIAASVPARQFRKILDLGCGTGRFTAALGAVFGCPVVGVEPSAAMLAVARAWGEAGVGWKQGGAESIPLRAGEVDLVFMSQVFHHLSEPPRALREINRVLRPGGYLAIRNGVREHIGELDWIRFFPEALEVEGRRMPSRDELERLVSAESFEPVSRQTVRQLFAGSHEEYFEKISRRGLSVLIGIGDAAFRDGLRRFQKWASARPPGRPVYEPVDLFIFRKKSV